MQGGITSPSPAFLDDAVEASGLSVTPSLQNYLRGGNGAAAEAATMSLADTLAQEDTGVPVSPQLLPTGASGARTDINNSAFASTLSSALDPKPQDRSRQSTDAPSRRSLESAATSAAPLAALEGASSRLTPGNSGPLVERMLSDVPGALGLTGAAAAAAAAAGSSESGAFRNIPASTGPSRATSVTSLEQPLSNAVLGLTGPGPAGGPAKAKGGGLSKAERRAKQEEQRAKKAALQAGVGQKGIGDAVLWPR